MRLRRKGGEMIRVRDVGYRYPGTHGDVLAGISLTLEPGERVCVLGLNASGKTTMAQLVAGMRFATEGEVSVDDEVISPQNAISIAPNVGLVAQDPRAQMVSSLVFDEVAFGLRCAHTPRKQVKALTTEALARCGIRHLSMKSTAELSGGQQQLVSLAAALAAHPAYLVLDEATSMLDSTSAHGIALLVDALVEEGMGVLEISHALSRAMGAHRICVLDRGVLVWSGTFSELLARDEVLGILAWEGDPDVALLRAVERAGFRFEPGTTQQDIIAYIAQRGLARRLCERIEPQRYEAADASAHELALVDASVIYGAHSALGNVSLSVGDELVVIAGPSGSGKTTCASALAGVLPLDEGQALLDGRRVRAGRVGFAMQYPQDQLFAQTVREDIAFGPRNMGFSAEKVDAAVHDAADAMGVSDQLDRSPFELSGGSARRVALAGVEALHPAAFIFDEPCAGLDAAGRIQAKQLVQRLRSEHHPVIVIAHEVQEWLDIASRAVFLSGGSVVCDCDARTARTSTQPYRSCGLEPPLAVSVRSLADADAVMGGERG